jgi:hypothetical protein
LPWDSIEPIAWNWQQNLRALRCPVTPELIGRLKTQSEQRQAVLPEFDYLNRLIDWLKQKQDQKVFSLNWSQRVAKRDKDQATNQELEQTWKALGPRALQPVKEVELDVCLQTQCSKQPTGDGLPAAGAGATPEGQDPTAVSQLAQAQDSCMSAEGKGPAANLGDQAEPVANPAAPEQKEEKSEGMDIHLQEALRILADWIEWMDQPAAGMPCVPCSTTSPTGPSPKPLGAG